MPTPQRICLYDAAQAERLLSNMARRVAGLLSDRTCILLVGVLRRGAPLAAMLKQRLEQDYGIAKAALTTLEIKRYSDDLTLLFPETQLVERPEHIELNLSGQTVVLVDDVMYTGHSMLRALQYLANKQAAEIRTVVLIDRGAAELPVRADVVGARLEVAPGDILECHVPPYEPELRIDLVRRG
jgi:pyrimidine operon attenuation protein / uracil phosphoribosyltransferase